MLIGLFGNPVAAYVAVSVGGIVAAPIIGWLLGKIPVEKLKKAVGAVMYRLGKLITLFLGGKFKLTKPYWNTAIEPFFIVFLEAIITHGLSEFIRGLRSDNEKK